MLPIEVKPGITWIGMNDRNSDLFEGLWPIKREGVSYNSYLIQDEKNAVIDLSTATLTGEYFTQLRSLIALDKLDYLIINHMEPDHTGALRALVTLAPQVQIVGTAKARDMLGEFYNLGVNFLVVKDGDTLPLGKHTLRFVMTPFVHWPETMMTYEESEQVLFSCDAFGGYGALNGTIFDDPGVPVGWYEDQALRYFVNIIATFCKPTRNAIAKLNGLPISTVAPSHGLVWRNNPRRIIDLYQDWACLATEPAGLGVTVLYASMYGNTEDVMDVVAQGIADAGLPLSIFDVARTPVSYILPSLWMKRGVLIGAPTYEGGLFPDMEHLLHMAATKHIYNRKAAYFGGHAWSGGAEGAMARMAETLRWEMMGSFNFTGSPSREELAQGRAFGFDFANRLKAE